MRDGIPKTAPSFSTLEVIKSNFSAGLHRKSDHAFDQDVKVIRLLSLRENCFPSREGFNRGMGEQDVQLGFLRVPNNSVFLNHSVVTIFSSQILFQISDVFNLTSVDPQSGIHLRYSPVEILHQVDHLLPVDLLPGHFGFPHSLQHLRPVIPHHLGHEDGRDLAFQTGQVKLFGSLRVAEAALFLDKDGFSSFRIARLVKISG